MNNENPVIRRPIRITRAHHTDLVCAAMNDTTGASQKILDRMTEDPGFQIDEQPVEGVFYIDQSIRFMYPHEIGFVEAVLPPDVVYPDGLPPPQFDLSYGVVPGHHFIDEMALQDNSLRNLKPLFSFNIEPDDKLKFADYIRKIKLSDTFGKFKPATTVDRLEDIPPIVSLDAERTLDGTKVADHVREMMMSDTFGKFKPATTVDSCPPELFALQAQDPIPSEDGTLIDPDQKPKPSPSGLLMRLMSRL